MRYSVAVLTGVFGVLLVTPLAGQGASGFLGMLGDADDAVLARLSPDGTMAALVSPGTGGSGSELVVHRFATSERRVVLRYEERRLDACAWKTDLQLLCLLSSDRGSAELLLATIDGSTAQEVGWVSRLLNVLPDDPTRVAVVRSGELGHIDLRTGKFRSYLDSSTSREIGELYDSRSDLGASYGVIDGVGLLRVRPGNSGWLMRPMASDRWVVFHAYEYSGYDLFDPVAFDERNDEVLHLDSHDGRTALFAFHIEPSGPNEPARHTQRLVLAPPFAYVVGVESLGKYPRPAQAVVFDGQVRVEPIDALIARVHDTVRRAFPGDVVDVVDEDWKQRYYLVRITDRAGVGQYQRFDSVEQRLDDLGPTRLDAVTKVSLPRTRLEFASAGGRNAAAYVTPPREAPPPWPIVVLPAGATNLTDTLVPFLATSGYAVLELPVPQALPNAVGIDLRSHVSDIGPAIEALEERHPVDTTRACAVGIEFGAYVALVHAAQDSARLRCVVGIETVVNPEWQEARSLLFEGPPMSASVLLMSGLAMGGVPRLNKGLLGAGVDVELVEYARGNYSAQQLREAFNKKLSEFLELNLR